MFSLGERFGHGECPQHPSRLHLYSINSKSVALQGTLFVAVIQRRGDGDGDEDGDGDGNGDGDGDGDGGGEQGRAHKTPIEDYGAT